MSKPNKMTEQSDYIFAAVTHVAASGVDFSRLHSAAHYGLRAGALPSRPQPSYRNDRGRGAVKPLMAYHGQNHPGVKSVGDRVHKQAHPRGLESTLSLSQPSSKQTHC